MLNKVVTFALSQRLVLLLLAAGIVVAGVFSLRTLPIDAYPDISTTQVQVIVKAPGMTPVEVEQRITRPMEIEVRGIPSMTVLRSLTKHALSIVTIDFEERTDIYWARQQVSERVNRVLGSLPPGVEGGLAPITSPLSEVFMFMVEGEGRSTTELRTILDWMIRPRLLSVPGVAEVNVLGGLSRAWSVAPRPPDLRALKIDVDTLIEAVRKNNGNAGGDRIVKNDEVFLVRTLGRLRTLADLKKVPVAVRESKVILLADVADVGYGSLTRYGGVTRNGRGEGVQGLILLRTKENGRKTVDAVKRRLREIEKTLPRGVNLTVVYDRSRLIAAAVRTVELSLLEGIVLVLLVLTLFLGNIRSAFACGLILPLSVLATFVLMRVFGISANLMSLGGIAIAVGILVDSSVVVVENVHTSLSQTRPGFHELHLIYRAVSEMAEPVVFSVLIIVASFLPILSLTGVEGKLFTPLALTITFALITSLVLTLTVIPAVSSLVMKGGKRKAGWLTELLGRAYRPVLSALFRHRRIAVLVSAFLLLSAFALVPFIGREFLPSLDEGTLVIQIEKSPTISLERSMEIDTQIQKALLKRPEIAGLYGRVGSDELRLDPMGFHQTDIFVVTAPKDRWKAKDMEGLKVEIRKILAGFPGVSYGFTQPIDMRVSEMLTGVRATVAVKLFGDSLAELDAASKEVETILKTTRGAQDIFRTPLEGQKYLELRLIHEAVARNGLSADAVNRLVSTAVAGKTVSEVFLGDRTIPITIRLDEKERSSKAGLEALEIKGPSGSMVRLGDLVEIREVKGPVQVQREMGRRLVVVQCNVKGRDVVGFVDEVRGKLGSRIKLPSGYYFTFGGQFENEGRATRRLLLVGPAALLIIFLLLFATFRSARQTVLVLLNVPFALIGGVVSLFASRLYFSVPASVGFIALLGVAIENAVVLISHFNELRRRGLGLDEAVRRGAERRLRPVLMTAILTILGLVPLLVASGPGSEIQRPLALVVVGGTLSSLVLTLVMLPTLYAWIEGRAARKLGAEVSGPASYRDHDEDGARSLSGSGSQPPSGNRGPS